jgi:hypothetical protein
VTVTFEQSTPRKGDVRVQRSFFGRAVLEKAKGSNQLRAIGRGLAGSVVFVPMFTSRV